MCRSAILLLLLALPALAQAPAPPKPPGGYLPAITPETHKLVPDRLRFVRDMYDLSGDALTRVTRELNGILAGHQRYQQQVAKTLERMDLGIAIITNDKTVSENDRAARIARLRSQIDGLHRKAPLSLANVVRIVEAAAPDKAATGRDRILARLGIGVKGADGKVDPAKIDPLYVVLTPPGKRVELLAQSTAPPPAPIPPEMPATPNVSTTTPPATPTPPPAAVPPHQQISPKTPPPAPPREIRPAPPESEWEPYVTRMVATYHFNAVQKSTAEKILSQCKGRLAAYRKEKQKAFDDAAKMPDGPDKASTLAHLNRGIDLIHDEMIQRLDAVVSVEQRAHAERLAQKKAD